MELTQDPGSRTAVTRPAWVWLAAALALALFWTVLMEGGVVSTAVGQSGPFLHELFHDGRHLVGVPCH